MPQARENRYDALQSNTRSRGLVSTLLPCASGAATGLPRVSIGLSQEILQVYRKVLREKWPIKDVDQPGYCRFTVSPVAVLSNPDAGDPIERVSSRPDFNVLVYPW